MKTNVNEIAYEPGMIFCAQKKNPVPANAAEWLCTTWKIYADGKVAANAVAGGKESKPFVLQLTEEDREKLNAALKVFAESEALPAADELWEMCTYTQQGDVAHRVCGAAAGVPALEALVEFLDVDLGRYL